MKAKYIGIWLAGIIIYFIIVARITLFDIIVAALVSLIATIIVKSEVVEKPSKLFSPKRWLYAIGYIIYYLFIVEPSCHLRVTSMILGLRKIKPDIVEVRYNYKTEYAVAATANSITNTPGTIVVDVDPVNKKYLVHWLEAYTHEPSLIWNTIVSKFDKWIKKIFEE